MKRLFMLCVAGALIMSACSKDEPTGPTQVNPGESATLVDSANLVLGDLMLEAIDSTLHYMDSSFRPSDLDFSAAENLYKNAVALDPTNLDAQFGAGFTTLLGIFSDPEVNALYERIKRFVDTAEFVFEEPTFVLMNHPGAGLNQFGYGLLPAGFPLSTRATRGNLIDLAGLDYALQASALTDPQPSDIQDILEAELLPRVLSANAYLAVVTQNRNYVFWITPEMQGNPGADSVELDMTEFRLARGTLYALEAAIRVAISRSLDVNSYSESDIVAALNQGSDFLTLRTGGATHLGLARTAILQAATQADSALTFLLEDVTGDPDQSDDLISIYPSDVSLTSEILDSLRSWRTILTAPREVSVRRWRYDSLWYGHYDTLTTTLNLPKFFDDPIYDPKTLLPGYTLTIDEDSTYKEIASLYFSRADYWARIDSAYGITYPNDSAFFGRHLPDGNTDEFYRMLAEDLYQTYFGWDDFQPYWYNTPHSYQYYSYWRDRHAWCFAWNATTFAGWNFPDPTAHGVFPELTNAEIKDFIYPDPSDWSQGDCASIWTLRPNIRYRSDLR